MMLGLRSVRLPAGIKRILHIVAISPTYTAQEPANPCSSAIYLFVATVHSRCAALIPIDESRRYAAIDSRIGRKVRQLGSTR